MAGGGSGSNRDRWLVSYADFITLMMVFFVVLYASARVDAQRFARLSASLRRSLGAQVGPFPGDGSGPVPGGPPAAPAGAAPLLGGEGGAGLPEQAAVLAVRGALAAGAAPPTAPGPDPAAASPRPPATAPEPPPEPAAPAPATPVAPPAPRPRAEAPPPAQAGPAPGPTAPARGESPAPAPTGAPGDPLADAARRLQGLPWPGQGGDVTIYVNDRGLVISLVGSLLFAPGSSELIPLAAPVLAAVAERVKDLPGTLMVDSLAGDVPPGTDALDLAARRGTAVARFLAGRPGFLAGRITVVGRTPPAATAGAGDGRVDIIVLRRADGAATAR